MAIITIDKVKALLQISDTSKDAAIEELIPVVQEFVLHYCNNYFELSGGHQSYNIYTKTNSNKPYRLESYELTFVAGTPAKITGSSSQFVTSGFLAGAHVRVYGSVLNDGIYLVNSVEPGVITLADSEALMDEMAGNNLVALSVVVFDKGIQLPVAKLIGHELNKKTIDGIASERLGDYSVSMVSSDGDYPPALLKGLNAYRKVKFV